MEKENTYLNPNQACDILGLSKSTLYKMTSEKRIPHYKLNGKKLLFKYSELVSFIEQCRINAIDLVNK